MSRPPTPTAGLTVLTYHAIGPERSVTAADPNRFADTIDAFLNAGWNPVDLQEWIARGRPDAPRGFALTFDDGLRSITRVVDFLTRRALRPTVFLVSDRVGADNRWPGQPRSIPSESTLDWSEIAGLARSGFRFASHGATHACLDQLSPQRVTSELKRSRAALEEHLGVPCEWLAYPYGRSSSWVRSVAARVYSAAFGTRLGTAHVRQDPFDLARSMPITCVIRAFYPPSSTAARRVGCDAAAPCGLAGKWRSARRNRGVVRMMLTTATANLNATDVMSDLACPACGQRLTAVVGSDLACDACDRAFPSVAGLPDLRLRSDRYLRLDAERAKAERLDAVARRARADAAHVASAYYSLTDDVVDQRRERFLRHIHGAVARGEALVDRLPANGLTLEIGCGTGGFLVAAARSGRAVVGVDVAARWLVVARRRLADHGLDVPLIAAEAESLPWPDATFDTIVADSVLEHLDNPAAALAECRRVVKPGGTLLIWSPNRFMTTVDPHLGLWGVGWLPRRWVPPYLAAATPLRLVALYPLGRRGETVGGVLRLVLGRR